MIQRKQTVFLLVALVLTIVCLCFPIGSFTDDTALGVKSDLYNLWIRPGGSYGFPVWVLFAILLLTCPIALIAIFSYRNRMVQSRFCVFNLLLILGWYVVYAVVSTHISESAGNFSVSLTAALPAVAMILYFMARKAILADEALVRSADRIR